MATRPTIAKEDSIRDAPHLVAELSLDGTASLHNPNETAFTSAGRSRQQKPVSSTSPASDVAHEEFQGLLPEPRKATANDPSNPSHDIVQKLKTNGYSSNGPGLTISLEKTDKAGRYAVSTDDPELRELLKQGFERSKDGEVTKKRSRFTDIVFTKQFTAFDRQNPHSSTSIFHGFFSLFWMAVSLMLIRVAANNWRQHGSIFGRNEIVRLMLSRDLIILGLVDGVMCGITVMSLMLQVLVFRGYVNWSRSGWILQNIWQAIFLLGFIAFTQIRQWPWTHSVFLTLHTITMLMKQHSYAFYNGWLSELYAKQKTLKIKLEQLDDPEVLSPSSPTASAHATSYFDARDLSELKHRRKSIHASSADAKIKEMDKDVSAIASAIHSDLPLSFEQVRALRKLIDWELGSIDEELRGTCKSTKNSYPSNLTILDFYGYIPLPTVVYELEYPRQDNIDWSYVAEKTTATFGVIGVMIVISTAYIYPVVMSIVKMVCGCPEMSFQLVASQQGKNTKAIY